MTMTDALVGAAVLWLLFVLCGMPGRHPGAPAARAETAAAAITSSAAIDAVPYSVWYQDLPQPRHVTPPLPSTPPGIDGISGATPENVYDSLGSAAVVATGLPQTLSLTEITIPPGGQLSLANPGGSGLIVIRTGWLELTERDGDASLTRSLSAAAPATREDGGLPTIATGDRISFGPEAMIVLRNRGENPAQLLTVSVMAVPGLVA